MKICVLLLTHKDIDMVNRLVKRIKNKNIDIYLHIDKKSNLDLTNLDKSVNLIKNRKKIYLFDYTQFDAIISSLNEIISKKRYDYYLFLSGQDYPTMSSDNIVKFFEENNGKEFVHYQKIDKDHWNICFRYENIYARNRYIRFLNRKLKIKLKYINNYIPYGGDAWFNITDDALSLILEICNKPSIKRRIRYMESPEEMIIQSILMNSDFKDKIVNNSLRFILWNDHCKGLNKGHPDILNEKNYEDIINSKKMFCRKIEKEKSEKLINMLDNYIDK